MSSAWPRGFAGLALVCACRADHVAAQAESDVDGASGSTSTAAGGDVQGPRGESSTSVGTSNGGGAEASSGHDSVGSSASEAGTMTGASEVTVASADATSSGESSTSIEVFGGSSTGMELGPPFVDGTAEAGLDHAGDMLAPALGCLIDSVDPPVNGLFCTPERAAGGAAVTDVDGDGDLDVFVTRPYSTDLLYLNDGSGQFTDVAEDVGLGDTLPSSGAAFGDIDDDGDDDLYVTTLGELRHWLFVNEDGVFVEDGEARGAAIPSERQHAGSTPVFGDFDLDGDLDLYVGEWRTSALGLQASHARLLRNLGPDSPGTFEDVTIAAGVDVDGVHLSAGGGIEGTFVFAAGWSDLDGDDYPDLLLASDFYCSRLFWNEHDGTFLDGTVAAGVGTDENGMGAAVGDYDGDGDLDWFVTSIWGGVKTGNRLYRYDGDRTFSDATDAAGVREGHWGWGAAFFDHDLDADLDLAMTNGWIANGHLDDPMVVWTNDGTGTFAVATTELGFDDAAQGRALVTFDADGDGDLDLLVVHAGGGVLYYRNDRVDDGMHWLRVRAPGELSNAAGIGAIVTVTTDDGVQRQEIGGTSHYLGHGPREAHFGLADDATIDVSVRWPKSGIQVDLADVAADQVLVVPEG